MSAANVPPPGNNSSQTRPASSGGSFATYDPPAGERPSYISPYSRTTYRPTAEQLTRDEARRHYLRRNVYAPIIAAVIVVVLLFLLVVALAFGIGTPQAAAFIAGLSALTIILFSIPIIILMSILPIAWLALTLNRRQQRKNYPEFGPMAYRNRLQIWLWQLDGMLDGARYGVERGSAAVRRPLTAIHARAAYIRGFADGIRGKSSRSI